MQSRVFAYGGGYAERQLLFINLNKLPVSPGNLIAIFMCANIWPSASAGLDTEFQFLQKSRPVRGVLLVRGVQHQTD